MVDLSFNRREFLAASALALKASGKSDSLPCCLFSKHLQFLQGDEFAQRVATLGFDGVDLTVRSGGHVEPEQVSTALPKLVTALRSHGLVVPMITTDITDAHTAHAEEILSSASALGIHRYRWGGLKYDRTRPLLKQLDAMKPRVAQLATLNKRYGMCAIYHTHSGFDLVGTSIWDLAILLNDFDPNLVAVNYDIGHATVEGGLGGWINSFHVVEQYIRGMAIKDFIWAKNSKGQWDTSWKPLGEGMVHFDQFFALVRERRVAGPLQLYFEYPLGGVENGKRTFSISQSEVFAAMKRDLQRLRGYLAAARLV